MKRLKALLKEYEDANHPGAEIIRAALECSNSPAFIHGVASRILETANKDLKDHANFVRRVVDSLTNRELELLEALRSAAEGCEEDGYRCVYLDNIEMRTREPRSFAGLLGSLTKKGFYKEEDDAFGMVRMPSGW